MTDERLHGFEDVRTVRERIIEAFCDGSIQGGCTAKEIADRLELPVKTVMNKLSQLRESGFLEKTGGGWYVNSNYGATSSEKSSDASKQTYPGWRDDTTPSEKNARQILDESIPHMLAEEWLRLSGWPGLTPYGRQRIEEWYADFAVPEIFAAMTIAVRSYADLDFAFEKVGGICKNRERQRDSRVMSRGGDVYVSTEVQVS